MASDIFPYILFGLLIIITGVVVFYFIAKVNIKDGYPRGPDRWGGR